ncbi:lysin B [Mycobacterium phage NoShow]|nr:lysin B [Mycobacterium phage NoShow]
MTNPVLQQQVSTGWHPPREPGDVDPLISDAKTYLKRFSYGQAEGLGTVDVDDTYTEGFGRALVQFKTATATLVDLGRVPPPKPDTDTEFDWATKKQMQLLPEEPVVEPPLSGWQMNPLYVTVEGHESDMWIGPAVEVGRRLEKEGLVQLQPTYYNNKGIPFKTETAVAEITRFFLDPVKMPPGRKFVLSGFSEGDIAVSRFILRHLLPVNGMFHHRLKDWICALEYGAPYRPFDYMGPVLLVSDPPKKGTGGISPEKLPALQNVAYVCRTGDIYTENGNDQAGRQRSAIYEVVANSNPVSLMWELLRVGISPVPSVLALAQSIGSGVLFIANMDPHGGYVLEPGQNWVRDRIKAAMAAR